MVRAPRPNAGKPWTPEDTGTLRRLADAGCPPRDIARQLGRSLLAVAGQALKIKAKLGMTNTERAVERRAAREQGAANRD